MVDVVSQFPPASWKVDGKEFVFPVSSISESHSNRIKPHNRLYRKGARLDNTGPNHKIWSITSEFYNGHEEPGLADPDAVYPDLVDAICDTFDLEATGDLVLSTRGPRRCKAVSYNRTDSSNERDFAVVTFEFWEDNEDDAKQSDFQQVSGKSAVRKRGAEGTDAAEAEGAGGGFDMSELNEFAGELEGLADAPFDTVQDFEDKANAISNKVESIEDKFTTRSNQGVNEVRLLLTQPSASLAGRRLRKTADLAKQSTIKVAAGPYTATTVITYERQVSIFNVATALAQDVNRLMILNSKIEDLLAIPAKTPIKVLDTEAARNAKATG